MTLTSTYILDLLEKSSLPGLYKSMVKNMLPTMDAAQVQDLMGVLLKEQTDMEAVNLKKQAIYDKYSPIMEAFDRDPSSVPNPPKHLIDGYTASKKEEMAGKLNLKLDTLKNVIK